MVLVGATPALTEDCCQNFLLQISQNCQRIQHATVSRPGDFPTQTANTEAWTLNMVLFKIILLELGWIILTLEIEQCVKPKLGYCNSDYGHPQVAAGWPKVASKFLLVCRAPVLAKVLRSCLRPCVGTPLAPTCCKWLSPCWVVPLCAFLLPGLSAWQRAPRAGAVSAAGARWPKVSLGKVWCKVKGWQKVAPVTPNPHQACHQA